MKPRFRRLAYAGAATVGAAVTAFALAGGPTTASAEQCGGAQAAPAVTAPLVAECGTNAQAAGAATEGRPVVRTAATPNEASPPPEESTGGAQEPAASTGPEVPETPEGNPVQPEASTPPEVPETTPPDTPASQPVEPSGSPSPSETPGEETTPPGQPQVPSGGTTPETGENQPQLPVTGDDTPLVAGVGAGAVLAGAGLLIATRRRRTN